jgi:hypothetical protein
MNSAAFAITSVRRNLVLRISHLIGDLIRNNAAASIDAIAATFHAHENYHDQHYYADRSKRDSSSGSHPRATPPAATRFVADSALDGDGFELFVPGHESAECRSASGVAGSSRTGEGDVGGGLHHRSSLGVPGSLLRKTDTDG